MSDELLISYKNARSWGLAPGDLFISVANRNMRIFACGDWIDEATLSRYEKKIGGDLKLLPFIDMKLCEVLTARWRDTFTQDFEKRIKAKSDLISLLKNSEISYLSFAVGTFSAFNRVPRSILDQLEGEGAKLFSRSLVNAALSTLVGLASGFDQGEMLSDLYHLTLFQDVPLWLNGLRFEMNDILASERAGNSQALNQMTNAEKNIFSIHPKLCEKWLEENVTKSFFDTSLIASIVSHHVTAKVNEKGDGRLLGGLSDWESILILSDHLSDQNIDWKGRVQIKNISDKVTLLAEKKLIPAKRINQYLEEIA